MLAKDIKIGDVITYSVKGSYFTKGDRYVVTKITNSSFYVIDNRRNTHEWNRSKSHNYWKEIEDPNQGVTLNQTIANLERADRLKPKTGSISAKMVIWDCRKDESLKFILSLIKA